MQIHYDIHTLPVIENAVITIGSFDGVHKGHKKILNRLKQVAHDIGGNTVLISFYPHPRSVVMQNEKPIGLLNTVEEKEILLAASGIDHLVITPFTEEFSQQTPQEYINNFLVKFFKPKVIVIGYDHKFGKNRTGDHQLLVQEGRHNSYQVVEIDAQLIEDAAVSSTNIRKLLLAGDISKANSGLGYHYMLSGTVVAGKQLGRTLGFPTANIEIANQNKLIPGLGIYAVQVQLEEGNTIMGGMLSIGTNPTVLGDKRTIEVYIFDFCEDIYGKEITLHLIEKTRDEQKFAGLNELIEALKNDEVIIREILAIRKSSNT